MNPRLDKFDLAILRELADAYDEVQRKYEQEALDRAKA